MVKMKIGFFITLAETDPMALEPGQEDMLLEVARDGDIIRILKDELIRIKTEEGKE